MEQKQEEIFEVRDYLIEQNVCQGFINMMDDLFIHKSITRDEIDHLFTLPKEEYIEFVENYKSRGPKHARA